MSTSLPQTTVRLNGSTKPLRFAYRTERQGGVITSRNFFAKCHKCGKESEPYRTRKHMPPDQISNWFKDKGWVTGKNMHSDLCPDCAGIPKSSQLAAKFKVTEAGKPVADAGTLVGQIEEGKKAMAKNTDDILARHLSNGTGPATATQAAPKPVVQAAVAAGEQPKHTVSAKEIVDGVTKAVQNLTAATELLLGEIGKLREATGGIRNEVAQQTVSLVAALREIRQAVPAEAAVTPVTPVTAPEQPKPVDVGPLGRYIREKRTALKLTMGQVAKQTGGVITGPGLGMIECGRTINPKLPTLLALAKVLKVPFEELYEKVREVQANPPQVAIDHRAFMAKRYQDERRGLGKINAERRNKK